jgi:hypothetical protein
MVGQRGIAATESRIIARKGKNEKLPNLASWRLGAKISVCVYVSYAFFVLLCFRTFAAHANYSRHPWRVGKPARHFLYAIFEFSG